MISNAPPDSYTVMVVAGEASGDAHGSHVAHELKQLLPGVRLIGLGGDEMIAEGVESVAHSRDISVVGFIEVLKILRRARQIFRLLIQLARKETPDAALLIDSPGFNLRLAKKLHSLGVPVLYYISPQVWAWRQGRVRGISKCVDKMMVLFPFEVDFYRDHGVDVVHVGHPLVDSVPTLEELSEPSQPTRESSGVRIGLMPGSRPSEVEALLPTFLSAAELLASELGSRDGATGQLEVVLVQAPTLDNEFVERFVHQHAGSEAVRLRVVRQDRFREIRDLDLVLCASGTATLEVALLGVPMIVAYRVAPVTYALARRLVKIDHIALVNLVLGERVVPEMIQHDARPESLCAEALRLLDNPGELKTMRTRLLQVRPALGEAGASRRVAAEIVNFLTAERGGEKR